MFKRINLKLGQKVLLANLTIIAFFTLTAVVTLFTLRSSRAVIANSSKVVNPSVEAIDEYILIVSNAKMYITNWVYLPNNDTDKEDLKELHNFRFPALKDKLTHLKRNWTNEEQKAEIDSIIIRFDEILGLQEQIMKDFASFGDYNDTDKKFLADETLEEKIIPFSQILIERLEALSKAKQEEKMKAETQVTSSLDSLNYIILILSFFAIVIGLTASYLTYRSIAYPVSYVSKVANMLSEGILPKDYEKEFGNDEIGAMARAMKKLVNGLKSTSEFAENIGGEKYDSEFIPLSDKDVLGNALINMRDNLRKVSEEEAKRVWTSEGIAKFGDILRAAYTSTKEFSEEVILHLVNYTGANQGGVFVIDETHRYHRPCMTLQGCYAWDRKKYLEKTIFKGEGLAGQAWQEETVIYVTDIPQDYIHITSGLGKSNPTSLLITPLKVNDQIFGVIEMAFFKRLEKYEMEFIGRIAENFASTLSSVRVNERTQRLLEDSQMMTEQMRAQEEEMRQNMEELQATQEEMRRTLREVEEKESILNAVNLIIEADQDFIIRKVNSHIGDYLKYRPDELIGKSIGRLFESESDYAVLVKMSEGGKIASRIVNLHAADRDRLLAKVSVASIYDRELRVKRLWFMIDNISEVKKHFEKDKSFNI